MSPEALILQPKVTEVRTGIWTSCGGSPIPAVPAALPLVGARVAAGAVANTKRSLFFYCADIAVHERAQVERVCVCGLHAWAPPSVGLRAAPERGRRVEAACRSPQEMPAPLPCVYLPVFTPLMHITSPGEPRSGAGSSLCLCGPVSAP